MDVVSELKFQRMSASKGQQIARLLRGLPVADALKVVEFSPRKSAALLGKTLKSAIANAQNNAKLAVDALRVKEAVVNEGPRLKRFWARSRGSASPVLKRLCHVRIVLTDGGGEAVERGRRATGAARGRSGGLGTEG
jgi:large subunit ribosomal protein L22